MSKRQNLDQQITGTGPLQANQSVTIQPEALGSIEKDKDTLSEIAGKSGIIVEL